MDAIVKMLEKHQPFFEKISRNVYLQAIKDGASAPERLRGFAECARDDGDTDWMIFDCPPGYTVASVAALLAALPLTRSATYVNLPEVVGCDALAEPDADVDAGKLIIVPGREGYRLGRAVNSLTTLTPDKAAPFQKIKIVEGIDLIRGDIAKAFESGYVGKVLNDYDNKLLLVTAINAYLKGLEGDVLDKTADNRCFVSLSGQRSYLESRGTDTSEMKDTDILKANTGSQVFLEAKLTFCDAMEDLALVISM